MPSCGGCPSDAKPSASAAAADSVGWRSCSPRPVNVQRNGLCGVFCMSCSDRQMDKVASLVWLDVPGVHPGCGRWCRIL